MGRKIVSSVFLAILIAVIGFAGAVAQEESQENARVRVAHFAPDAPNVDVFVNDQAVLQDVSYATVSDYMQLPPGVYRIAIAPTGQSVENALVGPVDLQFAAGASYLIAAVGQEAAGNFGPIVIDETAAFVGQTGQTRVLILHSVSGGDPVDVRLADADNTSLFEGLSFNSFAVMSVNAGDYPIQITASGDPSNVLFDDLNPIRLEAGKLYLFAAVGAADGEAQLVVSETPLMDVPVQETEPADLARVRIGHFSPDAPAVDVYVNGEVALENVVYPIASDYLELEPGTYTIAVAPAGEEGAAPIVGPLELPFQSGDRYLIAAVGQVADGTFGSVIIDESLAFMNTTLDTSAGLAHLLVLHAISDAGAVDVLQADGTPILEDLTFTFYSAVSVPPGDANYQITAADDPQNVLFNDLGPNSLQADTLYLIVPVGSTGAGTQLFTSEMPLPPEELALPGVLDLAAENPDLSTFLAAVNTVGLDDTLEGAGPFTVFAPTNEAFQQAAEALGITPEALLQDTATLESILQYHVVEGSIPSGDLVGMSTVTTMGGDVTVAASDNGLFLNDTAQVRVADLTASNGIIHVIDAVLIPPGQ